MKGLFRALVQGTRASNAIPAGAEKGAAKISGPCVVSCHACSIDLPNESFCFSSD